ncbi:hypothetical protein VNO78_26096 [Psophocarpus tetragonolobus]|uniref:Uncharacterized protein n=1 Tax=Psophocarpus tetragonolobus TaxID=3891 RepID=A0AAN9RZD0_PSOTE
MGFVDPIVIAVITLILEEIVPAFQDIDGLIVKTGPRVVYRNSSFGATLPRKSLASCTYMNTIFTDMTIAIIQITHSNNVFSCAWGCANAKGFNTAFLTKVFLVVSAT